MNTNTASKHSFSFYRNLGYIQLVIAIACCASSILLVIGPPFDLNNMPAVFMFDISVDIFEEFLCVILIACLAMDVRHTSEPLYTHALLAILITLEALALLADEGSWLVYGYPDLTDWGYLFTTFYFVWIGTLCYVWCHYLKSVIETPPRWFVIFMRIITVMYFIYLFMILNAFFGVDILFTIDENGIYHRLPMQSYGVVLFAVVLLISCAALFSQKQMSLKSRLVLSSFVLIPIVGAAIQMSTFGLSVVYQLNLLSLVMIFAQIHLSRGKQLAQHEQEMERQRTEIMLSQIQPHFLYNSLTAVMGIEGNPRETLDALSDFSKYLRGNLSVLNNTSIVPFTQEITHLSSYLNLEKLRFGDRLNIQINTPATSFMIPPLNLQMIAENAVKHGITAQDEGGTLTITSQETDNAFFVRVEDDGPGFNVEEALQLGEKHVGLRSVIDRLSYLCDGTVDIQSIPGVGSCVTIALPKKGQPQ